MPGKYKPSGSSVWCMKNLLCFLLCCFVFGIASAQSVKKLSIEELDTYINNSRKPLVVNFWATFCRPCIEELPHFLEFSKLYPQVELVLVSLDLPGFYPAKIEQFLSSRNITGATQFWLNETNADSFCPRIDKSWDGAIPVTLWVNPEKQYRKFVNRAMTDVQIKLAFQELTQ